MIVVDTSAILAILAKEDEYEVFSIIIQQSEDVLISAGTAVELLTLTSRYKESYNKIKSFLNESYISIVSVDHEQAEIAGEAYRKYSGSKHPARLNLGDTFAYALAKQQELPLLFKGKGFTKTDIKPVSGYFHYGVPQ